MSARPARAILKHHSEIRAQGSLDAGMNFYSDEFLIFFILTAVCFFLVPGRARWLVLLVASYFFYGAFGIGYLAAIAFTTLTAYLTALGMARFPDPSARKIFLCISLFCNILLLLVFKYYNFFNASVDVFFSLWGISFRGPTLELVLTVGLSFYVFQVLSYSIDVYRGDTPAEKHLGFFALYVAFFPKLLAGPIERAGQFIPQLRKSVSWDGQRITNGLKLVAWGLFKKLVIADRLAAFVDIVFADPAAHSGVSLAMASVFYSFQIYCDFSGYTDIAIGLSQIFGIRLTDNFNRPYSATSIRDFWKRWHISLSTWLRDYLYIPLGGNQVRIARLYLNFLIVFFICGLWHGTNWTFIIWGILHGVYLIAGRASMQIRTKLIHAIGLQKIPSLHKIVQILITFGLVTIAWIFFRADSVADAVYILSHLHTGWGRIADPGALEAMILLGKTPTDLAIVLSGLMFMGLVHRLEKHENMRAMFAGKPLWVRFSLYYILVAGIVILSLYSVQNFIYFQF